MNQDHSSNKYHIVMSLTVVTSDSERLNMPLFSRGHSFRGFQTPPDKLRSANVPTFNNVSTGLPRTKERQRHLSIIDESYSLTKRLIL